jgi:hypothetical protein
MLAASSVSGERDTPNAFFQVNIRQGDVTPVIKNVKNDVQQNCCTDPGRVSSPGPAYFVDAANDVGFNVICTQ